MVEKKEGATMTCKNCNTNLTCRLKEYTGDFKPALQWQNKDGAAHYSTKNGKDFTCNIPDDSEGDGHAVTLSTSTEQETIPTTKPSIELLDDGTKKIIKSEALLLFHVRKEVEIAIKEYEDDPHGGMIGQFTELIWKKYFGDKE